MDFFQSLYTIYWTGKYETIKGKGNTKLRNDTLYEIPIPESSKYGVLKIIKFWYVLYT